MAILFWDYSCFCWVQNSEIEDMWCGYIEMLIGLPEGSSDNLGFINSWKQDNWNHFTA